MENNDLTKEISELITEKKSCAWCIHADLGDGACHKCENKSLWNVPVEQETIKE